MASSSSSSSNKLLLGRQVGFEQGRPLYVAGCCSSISSGLRAVGRLLAYDQGRPIYGVVCCVSSASSSSSSSGACSEPINAAICSTCTETEGMVNYRVRFDRPLCLLIGGNIRRINSVAGQTYCLSSYTQIVRRVFNDPATQFEETQTCSVAMRVTITDPPLLNVTSGNSLVSNILIRYILNIEGPSYARKIRPQVAIHFGAGLANFVPDPHPIYNPATFPGQPVVGQSRATDTHEVATFTSLPGIPEEEFSCLEEITLPLFQYFAGNIGTVCDFTSTLPSVIITPYCCDDTITTLCPQCPQGAPKYWAIEIDGFTCFDGSTIWNGIFILSHEAACLWTLQVVRSGTTFNFILLVTSSGATVILEKLTSSETVVDYRYTYFLPLGSFQCFGQNIIPYQSSAGDNPQICSPPAASVKIKPA